MGKYIAVTALSLALGGCVSGLSQFTHNDAVAAQESAELRNDPSAKCWGKIAELTGLQETKIIGIMTAVQKARNIRRFIENPELKAECAGVAWDILMTMRRLPFIP